MAARQPTHRVPHHDVHVGAERVVHVLSEVQVQEVAEVVIHVNTWRQRKKPVLTNPKEHMSRQLLHPFCLSHDGLLTELNERERSFSKHDMIYTQVILNLQTERVQNSL